MPVHQESRSITLHLLDPQQESHLSANAGKPESYWLWSNDWARTFSIEFQREPKGDGFTNEILLAIVLDRLEHLNEAVPCPWNEKAKECLGDALLLLKSRTFDRIKRGVEGTNKP